MEAHPENQEKKCEILESLNKIVEKNFKVKEGQETHAWTLNLTEESYTKIFNILNKNVVQKVANPQNKKAPVDKDKKGIKPPHAPPKNVTKVNDDKKKVNVKPKEPTKPKIEKKKTEEKNPISKPVPVKKGSLIEKPKDTKKANTKKPDIPKHDKPGKAKAKDAKNADDKKKVKIDGKKESPKV